MIESVDSDSLSYSVTTFTLFSMFGGDFLAGRMYEGFPHDNNPIVRPKVSKPAATVFLMQASTYDLVENITSTSSRGKINRVLCRILVR